MCALLCAYVRVFICLSVVGCGIDRRVCVCCRLWDVLPTVGSAIPAHGPVLRRTTRQCARVPSPERCVTFLWSNSSTAHHCRAEHTTAQHNTIHYNGIVNSCILQHAKEKRIGERMNAIWSCHEFSWIELMGGWGVECAGVIHRDLKPENVLIDAHGYPSSPPPSAVAASACSPASSSLLLARLFSLEL